MDDLNMVDVLDDVRKQTVNLEQDRRDLDGLGSR